MKFEIEKYYTEEKEFKEEVEVNTIEDLKTVSDRFEKEADEKEEFYNGLHIVFDEKKIWIMNIEPG